MKYNPMDLDSIVHDKPDNRQDHEDLRAVLETPTGRRVMRRVLDACRLEHSSFNTNALAMAFNEGARSVGLHLLRDIQEALPDHWMILLHEKQP